MLETMQLLRHRAGIHISPGRLFLQLEKGHHTRGAGLGCCRKEQRENENGTSLRHFHSLPHSSSWTVSHFHVNRSILIQRLLSANEVIHFFVSEPF